MAHNYTNTASKATLDAPLNSSSPTFSVTGFTGYPSVPFYALLDRDTSSAELVEVTNVAGSTLTANRGAGGTASTSHSAGGTVEHVIPAAVPQAVEQHIEASANVHGVTGNLIGADSTGTLANKTFRGAHRHDYSDTEPAAPNGGFVVNADSSLGRDGFVANNAGANTDRAGFALRQSGSDRFLVYYDGTVKVNPSGVSGRPSIETTGNVKAENFESTDDITAAGDITAIGNMEAAAGNFGNVNVSGGLSSTGTNTFGSITAAGNILANASGTGLTVANTADIGTLNVTSGNAVLAGANARLQLPPTPTPSSPGSAVGQVRYRGGRTEQWDGTYWRTSYASGFTDHSTASGTVSSSPAIVNQSLFSGSSPYTVMVQGQCEINGVPSDGTRWDIIVRLDNATSGTVLSTGIGNGFCQTGVGFTAPLTGDHTIYFTLVRALGSSNMTLSPFNQQFTTCQFGSAD